MKVRDVMTTDLIVATPDMPLDDAVALLIEHRVTGLPVIDDHRALLGVITEMDVMRIVAEPHQDWRTVRQLMTPDPRTLPADAPLHDAFDCLMSHSFRRVFIEEEGRLVGLISRTDLLPNIFAQAVEPQWRPKDEAPR